MFHTQCSHKLNVDACLCVEKHIPSKDIPSDTGDRLKKTKNNFEDENDKQGRTSTGCPLKIKKILRDENDKQVLKSMGYPLKKKEMFRDKKGKLVRTYAAKVSTGKLSN